MSSSDRLWNFWWVTGNKQRGSIDAPNKYRAMQLFKEITGCNAETCDILPYPSEPRLNHERDCPSFCFQPDICQGNTCCPRRFSCCE